MDGEEAADHSLVIHLVLRRVYDIGRAIDLRRFADSWEAFKIIIDALHDRQDSTNKSIVNDDRVRIEAPQEF